jgi:hypothetical protein
MKIKRYRQAMWSYDGASFTKKERHDLDEISWSSVAPCTCPCPANNAGGHSSTKCSSCSHFSTHPPKDVILHPGDVLYIPAFTYHELSHPSPGTGHSPNTIAINYWFDTEYGANFASMETLDRLARLIHLNE